MYQERPPWPRRLARNRVLTSGAKRNSQSRMVSWVTSYPRCSKSSATSRKPSLKRKRQRTANSTTSVGNWRSLKGVRVRSLKRRPQERQVKHAYPRAVRCRRSLIAVDEQCGHVMEISSSARGQGYLAGVLSSDRTDRSNRYDHPCTTGVGRWLLGSVTDAVIGRPACRCWLFVLRPGKLPGSL